MTNETQSFTMPSLLAVKTLTARIHAWGKNASSMQEELILLAEQALLHFHNHGDATAASLLLKVTPGAMRQNALKAWFQACAPLTYVQKEEQFKKDKSKDAIPVYSENPEGATPYIVKGLSTPFFKMFREPEVKYFDEVLFSKLDRIIKDYEKARENQLVQGESSVGEIIQQLRNLRVTAEQVKNDVDLEIPASAIVTGETESVAA